MKKRLSDTIDDIEEGNINPLDVFRDIKLEVDEVISLFETIKQMSIIDSETRTKTELLQSNIEFRAGSALYSYESDSEYSKIKSRLKEIEVRMKETGEATIKGYKKSSIIVRK